MTYNPKYAWARAFIYFAVCILISYLSGALELVLGSPLVTAEQVRDPKWITLLLVSCAVIFIGYFIIWPRGTLTHGRRQNLVVVGTFGLSWGLSEGLFFLTVFVLAHKFILPTISASVAAFIIVSTFLGLWHQFYWDIYIAPEHNIPEWNAKKVLFAHIPNLIVTITFLTLYGNAAIFVFLQTIALVTSTYFMRLPAFWEEHPGRVF